MKIRKLISKKVEAIDRKLDIQPLSKKRKIDLHITEGQSETHGSTSWLTLNNINLSSADKDMIFSLLEMSLRICIRGVARGRAQGAFAPPFFPESCNIHHFLPYKYQHQVVTAVFRVKNYHRIAD